MDESLLFTDDQTLSSLALTESHDGVLDLSALHSSKANMLSAQKTGTETVSGHSDPTDKPTELLSVCNVCKSLSQGKSTDSDCSEPTSSCCNMSESFPPYSEPSVKDDDFRFHAYFGSSAPLLPQPSHNLHSSASECFSEIYTKCESGQSLSPIKEIDTTHGLTTSGAMSSICKGLTEPSITEPLFSHSFGSENSPATILTQPLSPQSDVFESDAAKAPVSDLYIFESETSDFIQSPSVALHEIGCLEYHPLSQTWEKETDGDCDTHVLMCDSAGAVTQCHRGSAQERAMVDNESNLIQHVEPPVVDACEANLISINDARQQKAEVTSLPQPWLSDSPVELWLDACQYLAEESREDRDVSDETGCSVIQEGFLATSDLSFLPRETQVSIYNPEVSEGIGWSSDDTRGWGPQVKRWSSVDSWATALSDWTGIITNPPEDFTAAFTEIGAEIDALTQALAGVQTDIDPERFTEGQTKETGVQSHLQPPMGVQDQPLEVPNISEQSFLSLSFKAAGLERLDREDSIQSTEYLNDATPTTQGEKESEEIQSTQAECSQCPIHQHSSMGSSSEMVASPVGSDIDVTLISGSTLSGNLDLSQFNEYVKSLETDTSISNDGDPIILNIIEDTDLEGQHATAEPINKEFIGGGLCEIKDGHTISKQGFVAVQEALRGCRPASVVVRATESLPDLHLLHTDTLTHSYASGVEGQSGLQINVSGQTLTGLDGACQVDQQGETPKFITPLVPLSIGSSLDCQTSSTLEGDQACVKRSLNDNRDLSCDHVQPSIAWTTSDGITDNASVAGDAKLIHKSKNTIESSAEARHKHTDDSSVSFLTERKTITEEINDLSRDLLNLVAIPADHFFISEETRVAIITLDLNHPYISRATKPFTTDIQLEKTELNQEAAGKMPHKTHKNTTESKTRSKKDKSGGHHHGAQISKKQESLSPNVSTQLTCKQQDAQPLIGENHTSENTSTVFEEKEAKLVIETDVAAEKASSKPHAKKKKKHVQNTTAERSVPLVEVENGAKPKSTKGRIDMFEAKLGAKAGKSEKDSNQRDVTGIKSQQPDAKPDQPLDHKDRQPKSFTSPLNDDVIKRRRLSEDKFGKIVSTLESKLPNADVSIRSKGEELKVEAGAIRKKAYSEVVKQTVPVKEDIKVVQPIQAMSVSGDPQSLCLWCQFAAVLSDYTVNWSREGTALAEIKRSAGDESRVSFTISNASHKHLGKYQCRLSSLHGSLTLDYVLTYEVLSEIVIPLSPKTISSPLVDVESKEEDVRCSRLMFKEDFLSDQYFGENHPASIITEKAHFGEGMHRRAFRTKMHAGQIPLLLPGHSCVLKVHNAISYGTKNSEELIQRNFSLAVEECQVQNTAREYIKAYTAAAESTEAFGEVPDIIPIYLVHRPANDIPYATLEEELIGDFVKYSVKDGKEINLMRRDSEAGQKCCAFQHWVYHKTEGNLLVTDMQGVGMKLTDVGIATCKKGYKGFKGNCATSFIDQFKALHQCNKYCEILGLKSLQPKSKKPANAPKPKPQPSAAPKKKTFGPTAKGKS